VNWNEELKSLASEYGLTNKQIAEMTGYAVDTVKAWRAERRPDSKKYRKMPERAMKLLKFEIADRNLKRKT
jgi:DNA-binding transcriptional regulator YiaG